MLDKIIDLVKPFAPAIATALAATGPAGMAIAAGASMLLKKKLCDNPDATDNALLQQLQDPEVGLKLQQAENDFKLQMRQLDVQEESIHQQDRNSARNRQIELARTGYVDHMPAVLAIGFLIIYAVIQVFAIYNPGGQDDIISARVQDIVIMIVSFYFGSSSSSRKNSLITQKT